jgi:RNA polymerase sigma factor (sigma-70 family)
MPSSQASPVLRYVREVATAEYLPNLADRELLERFITRHDQTAFAVLVHRHGPMVRRLCLHVLHNEQDAEDVFQATFLVLSRKAASLRPQESLAGWLYSVAYRIAQKARIDAARRRKHEGRAAIPQVADPLGQITLREAHEVLDRELARLPDKFRAPLVLCYLEGLTRDEAAHQLGWSPSILKSRLEQARDRLRARLASRGLALSGPLVASLFSGEALAAVPPVVPGATVKAAMVAAAGGAAGSVVSARVAALAEGVVKAMFSTKLEIATAALLAGGLVLGMASVSMGLFNDSTLATARGDQEKGTPKALPARKAGTPKTDQQRLQGTWEFVCVAQGDETKRVEEFAEEDPRPKTITFTGDMARTVLANTGGKEVEFHTRFKLGSSRKPKTFHETALDGRVKGETVEGLYQLDGDTLRLCYPARQGQKRPTTLASKSKDGSINYLLLTFKRVHTKVIREDAHVRRLAWNPNGKTLATVALTHEIVEFKTSDGKDKVSGACWPNSTIKLYDAQTGELERSLGEEKHTHIMAIAFSPDGMTAAVAAAKLHEDPRKGKMEVRLLDAQTWVLKHKVTVEDGAGVSALAFSPDGTRLALGGASWLVENGSFVRLWDVKKGKRIGPTKEKKAEKGPKPARLGKGHVFCLAFSRDGKVLAAGDRDGKVRLFDGQTGERSRVLEGHGEWVSGVGFTLDGATLVSASGDKTVKLWDVKAGKLRRTLKGNKGSVTAFAISGDGQLFATAGEVKDKDKSKVEVILWDTKTGKPKKALPAQTMQVQSLAFSPDGRTLAIGGGNPFTLGPDTRKGRLQTPGELKFWKPRSPSAEKK